MSIVKCSAMQLTANGNALSISDTCRKTCNIHTYKMMLQKMQKNRWNYANYYLNKHVGNQWKKNLKSCWSKIKSAYTFCPHIAYNLFTHVFSINGATTTVKVKLQHRTRQHFHSILNVISFNWSKFARNILKARTHNCRDRRWGKSISDLHFAIKAAVDDCQCKR